MDLSETRSNHPNLIASADAGSCTIGATTYQRSIIIPSHNPVSETGIQSVDQLNDSLISSLCDHQPELIILATGATIIFPEPDVLDALVKNNIGLEVLNNQAAARTFNVLLAEARRTVCLMLISP
jgi:uncharacterized protein